MRRTLSILLLICFCLTAKAQNNYFEIYTDSAALKNQNDKLIRDIETRVRLVEPSFSFKGLTTDIPKTFMPGQYRSKPNKIYQLTWQIGGPPMENFLTEMGGSADKGKSLAALFFYGFFLPHEVGHALQHHTNKVPENTYDAEYEANELAVVYWRSKGRDKELQQCNEMAKKILTKLANPIPENADAKKYITAHYDELLKDPYKYAFIQFSQIVKILDDKSLPDFDAYIKKYFIK
jgi:hypothetical protein